MKKLFLFFSAIALVATMSSCLKGDNSYTDQGFVYFASSENNTLHGRTSGGRLITSTGIRQGMLTSTDAVFPDDFFVFGFSWHEADGFTDLGGNIVADNVAIITQPIEIPRAHLSMTTAPEQGDEFVERIVASFLSEAFYWGDNWIINFAWRGGERIPQLDFYVREMDPANPNNVDIDVRMSGVTEGTADRGHAVVLNMSQIRAMFPAQSTQQVIQVRFHFHQRGFDAVQSEVFRWTLVAASSGQ